METNIPPSYDFSYFKNLADQQYEKSLLDIQRLINHANEWSGDNKQLAEKTNQILFWCLNEYQKENDHMNLYTLTRESIYHPNPIVFLENLHSFIGNNVYDDGCFVVEYRDYPDEYYQTEDYMERWSKFGFNKNYIRKVNGIFDYDNETMSNWEPVLKSSNDCDLNCTQNPDYILSAIKFMEDKELHMIEWDKKMKKHIEDMED
jgi:hypothetical protein